MLYTTVIIIKGDSNGCGVVGLGFSGFIIHDQSKTKVTISQLAILEASF